MKITINKNDDRYGFKVLSNFGRTVYSSSLHYFLTPFVKSGYKYAWEACRDAWKLAYKHPYHIQELRLSRYDMDPPVKTDVSAEEMLITHYLSIIRNLRLKAKGVIHDPEERAKVYQEAKMVIDELNMVQEKITDPKEKNKIIRVLKHCKSIIQKYFKEEARKDLEQLANTKIASCVEPESDGHLLDDETRRALLDEYAQRSCRAIQGKHDDIYYVISLDLKEITLHDFNNNPLIKIRVNEFLNVDSIIPVGKLYKVCPLHSVSFYQKYWKPIVEELKHFSIGYPPVLIKVDHMTLPDVPRENQGYIIEGWNCADKTITHVDISFKGEKPVWTMGLSKSIKIAQKIPSKYMEQDYLNAIVKCIDPNLKSIYGRTGATIQVIPLDDMIEVDVDFGRGLGVVRLTEKQIEIVSAGV